MSTDRPAVVLFGPRPPPIGGYTTYCTILATRQLDDDFGVHNVDTSRPTAMDGPPGAAEMVRYGAKHLRDSLAAVRLRSVRISHHLVDYRPGRIALVATQFALAGRAGWKRILDMRAGIFQEAIEEGPRPAARALESIVRRAEVLCFEGERDCRYALDRWGIHAHHMPSFVPWQETGGSHRADTAASDGPVRVVFGGRLNRDKGIIELARAAVLLRDRLDFELTFVGPRNGDAREEVEAIVAREGLGDRVRFTGRLPRAEYLSAVAAGQIYAMPTRHHGEGHPNALTEAMAMGLAIITCDQGFVADVVGRDAGVIVPRRDPAALADALEELARDPGRRSALGSAARERARERFSDIKVMSDWAKLYRGLLGAGAG